MRGKDRREERDELKSQLMLFQLLPREKKKKKKDEASEFKKSHRKM